MPHISAPTKWQPGYPSLSAAGAACQSECLQRFQVVTSGEAGVRSCVERCIRRRHDMMTQGGFWGPIAPLYPH